MAFVVADGKAAMRELQLGISDGKQTEVLGGLETATSSSSRARRP